VTFEIFASAALELLAGQREPGLPFALARLTADFRHKPGLTRVLPARLSDGGAELTPLLWHGSGDIPALARANAFLVADAERESWSAGDLIEVLVK
jgi:molybdopterin molybdotransferase